MAQFIIIFNEEYFTEEDYYTLYWHSIFVAHILVMFFDERRDGLKSLVELKSLSGIGIVSVGTPGLLLALLDIF